MFRKYVTLGAFAATLVAGFGGVLATPASAQQINRVQVGTLECTGSKSVSFIIGSKRTLDCRFVTRRGARYAYEGTIRRWGLDVGVTGRNALVWGVFAPTTRIDSSDLAGRYTGVSGSVALGVGVGGNALLGGSKNTVALQPFSVEGQTGVNLAVGVGDLTLRAN
ncbi:DUF992 domain-containing protein [Ancylobacter sonchi]|uniref:DUF992 domain-containing protein n=1 Tax=Ancylobacter sonchi TaxID=1937790 RepID=UPI001BD55DFD|nr:DUF992 domain-containing protein [Ancylobacter sonchi]MBS7535870.1 DUF992 domain-containing protein [Ancylobacter sonchi]